MKDDAVKRVLRELNAVCCLLTVNNTNDEQYQKLLQAVGSLNQVIYCTHMDSGGSDG